MTAGSDVVGTIVGSASALVDAGADVGNRRCRVIGTFASGKVVFSIKNSRLSSTSKLKEGLSLPSGCTNAWPYGVTKLKSKICAAYMCLVVGGGCKPFVRYTIGSNTVTCDVA